MRRTKARNGVAWRCESMGAWFRHNLSDRPCSNDREWQVAGSRLLPPPKPAPSQSLPSTRCCGRPVNATPAMCCAPDVPWRMLPHDLPP